ncbi:MAG TPA: hypothetical protein PKZ33_06580 [Brevefilum sp.]|nr:hypothetical protein [Brevefilum sp.]
MIGSLLGQPAPAPAGEPGDGMSYKIIIINRWPLKSPGFTQVLLDELKTVDFESLCRQYGLDPALIGPTLAQLSVEESIGAPVPFFLLRYHDKGHPPIVISEWEIAGLPQQRIQEDQTPAHWPDCVLECIATSRAVYSVTLEGEQLTDLGLLLAYEVARWIAHQGSGIVLGLDAAWYRLNEHQAFIPLQ